MFRVLIADDNPQIRSTMSGWITTWNPHIEVLEAESGAEAVGSAITDQPNLIFMGTQMPLFDGATAAQILRAKSETKNIPLIGMTTNEPDNSLDEQLMTVCDSCLQKPLNSFSLESMFNKLTRGMVD